MPRERKRRESERVGERERARDLSLSPSRSLSASLSASLKIIKWATVQGVDGQMGFGDGIWWQGVSAQAGLSSCPKPPPPLLPPPPAASFGHFFPDKLSLSHTLTLSE